MNNTHLSRRISDLQEEFEYTIDELIAEIEELESDKNKMQDEIDSLKEQIEDLQKDKC
jgi:hypothetical protein